MSAGDADKAPSDTGSSALPALDIVHEGRGGFIAIDTCRYPIEHIEGGHFCIHFPAGQRHRHRDTHLLALESLVREEAPKWQFANRSKAKLFTP
jgi:hypothetical protein